MSTLVIDRETLRARGVQVTDDAVVVDLVDGRTISTPLAWYPRLLHGSTATKRRRNCASGSNRCSKTSRISAQRALTGSRSRKCRHRLFIRRICTWASDSNSASSCFEIFESLPDHDAPTTTDKNRQLQNSNACGRPESLGPPLPNRFHNRWR